MWPRCCRVRSPGLGLARTASSADRPTLSTSATLVIHFLKSPFAWAPTLNPVPTRHLCTPRQDHGVVISGPREDPDPAGGHGPYSFALGPNPTVQRDWHLQALNGVWWGKAGDHGQGGRRGWGGASEMRWPCAVVVGLGLGPAPTRD